MKKLSTEPAEAGTLPQERKPSVAPSRAKRKTQNVSEGQRGTKRLNVRLPPEIHASIHEWARAWGVDLAEIVTEGHRALIERERRRARGGGAT